MPVESGGAGIKSREIQRSGRLSSECSPPRVNVSAITGQCKRAKGDDRGDQTAPSHGRCMGAALRRTIRQIPSAKCQNFDPKNSQKAKNEKKFFFSFPLWSHSRAPHQHRRDDDRDKKIRRNCVCAQEEKKIFFLFVLLLFRSRIWFVCGVRAKWKTTMGERVRRASASGKSGQNRVQKKTEENFGVECVLLPTWSAEKWGISGQKGKIALKSSPKWRYIIMHRISGAVH